jgi:asparagine synthetase B (glutamine-hydrolysing)
MIDTLLEKIVAINCGDEAVAILLSGGVDSLSLAITAHRLGKKVHAYTFHLEDLPTYDAEKAKSASDKMGWDCTTIVVPKNNLENDFETLRNNWKRVKKTHYDCTFPINIGRAHV